MRLLLLSLFVVVVVAMPLTNMATMAMMMIIYFKIEDLVFVYQLSMNTPILAKLLNRNCHRLLRVS